MLNRFKRIQCIDCFTHFQKLVNHYFFSGYGYGMRGNRIVDDNKMPDKNDADKFHHP